MAAISVAGISSGLADVVLVGVSVAVGKAIGVEVSSVLATSGSVAVSSCSRVWQANLEMHLPSLAVIPSAASTSLRIKINKILNIHGKPLDHLPTSTVTVYITVAVMITCEAPFTQVWLESGREWIYTAAGRVYSWSGYDIA